MSLVSASGTCSSAPVCAQNGTVVSHLPASCYSLMDFHHFTLCSAAEHTAHSYSWELLKRCRMLFIFFLEHDIQGTDSGEGNVSSGTPSKASNISSHYKGKKCSLEQDWNADLPIPCHWPICMLLPACSSSGSKIPGFIAMQ